MRQIFKFMKPYSAKIVFVVIVKTLATSMAMLIPWAMTRMLQTIAPMKNPLYVVLWGLMMLAICGLALFGNIKANRMASLVARNTTERVRLELFAKISYLSMSDQEEVTGASLISRATTDTYNVHQFLGMMQRMGIRQPLVLIVSLVITGFMDYRLMLIMLALIPVMLLSALAFMRFGRPLFIKVREALDNFVRIVREDVNGIRVIKALSKDDSEKKRFETINRDVVKKNQHAALVMGGMHPVIRLILNVGLVLIIWFGARQVDAGKTAPEVLLAMMTYVTMILNAVIFITRFFMMYTQAAVSGNRIAEILSRPDTLVKEPSEEPEETVRARAKEAEIRFEDVSFSYRSGGEVLKDVSFSLPKGKTLGIIGATGAGKSTIVNLMLRFYDPASGHVYVDGRDVKNYTLEDLRAKFGAVFQNDIIFRGSIRENIRFGREIDDETILRAAKAAQAEFVGERGLDSELLIRGSNLSGGQKQRIYIARALAGDPEILVLDDSSSALDYETDARLRGTIREQFKDTTLVVVAQRISSIMDADLILVLDEGKLIGSGSHEELMEDCEIYREIAHSQMGTDEAAEKGKKLRSEPSEEEKQAFLEMAREHPKFRDAETYEDVVRKVFETQKAFAKRNMHKECLQTVRKQLNREKQETRNVNKKRIFARLMGYMLKRPVPFIAAILLTILTNVLALWVPRLSGQAIDALSAGPHLVQFTEVEKYCMIMLLAVAVSAVLSYLATLIMSFITKRILSSIRREMFDRILHLRVGYFDTHAAGDIISKITYDVSTINTSLSGDLVTLASSAVTVIGSFIMMLAISPVLLSVFLVTIPLTILYTRRISMITRPLFRARSGKLGELNGFIEERISGQRTLKAYNRELDSVRRFEAYNESAVDAYYKADYMAAFNGPMVNTIGDVSLTFVTMLGALLFMNGSISLGNISSFVLYSKRFSGPINEAANIVAELQSALAASERVFRLIDEPVEAPLSEHEEVLTHVNGDVEMSHVNFGYTPDKVILHDLSLTAPAGKTVAIVGPTGAGKTTIISLLMRFYDINGGKIFIDGKETRELTRDSVRRSFAMVLQDTWLFTGTIYENLVYGREDATMEEVVSACKAARIHNYIMRLPDQYDTLLTDEGSNLSKGQKQLLTIARAMLLNAHMLIFDEATSNVDTRTEIRLQEAMLALMKEKTCFIIAHRLSTIQHADHILVVNQGDVVEQGTHEELLTKQGFYHNLYEAQWSRGEAI